MPEAMLQLANEGRIRGLGVSEVQAALRAHNPTAPVKDLQAVARIMSLVFDFVTDLPVAERREIAREKVQFRTALQEAAQSLGRMHIEDDGEVEHTRGAGLGEVIALEEGRARLDRYASHTPMEEWAGPVAGAGEIEKRLGIARSTLSSWVQQSAVVGLLRGQRKLAYPLDQFVDARPLGGLAELLRLAPDARSAWLWARQHHGALGGKTPIESLRAGQKEQVIAAAERDFVRELG